MFRTVVHYETGPAWTAVPRSPALTDTAKKIEQLQGFISGKAWGNRSPQWETYVDQSKPFERRIGAGLDYASDFHPRLGREEIGELTSEPDHAPRSEAAARFIAYAGPYLFWSLVAVLTAGIVLLR